MFKRRQLDIINIIVKKYYNNNELLKDNVDENGYIINYDKETELVPGFKVSIKELRDIRSICKRKILENTTVN